MGEQATDGPRLEARCEKLDLLSELERAECEFRRAFRRKSQEMARRGARRKALPCLEPNLEPSAPAPSGAHRCLPVRSRSRLCFASRRLLLMSASPDDPGARMQGHADNFAQPPFQPAAASDFCRGQKKIASPRGPL
ncbi:hypothetical protein L1887_46818 [Cichorium endivia]|nr:hypothetical protein L1887_46818 [Cichorium endivia]